MRIKAVSGLTALAVLLSAASPALAGGYGGECYERVHVPPTYGTVQERVLIRPASHRVEIIPAIYGTEKRRVLIAPERIKHHVIPAEYGVVKERVIIQPERVVARIIPAVTKTIYRDVMVSGGGYAWEWRIIKGKKVLCKVKTAPVYRQVAETVVVYSKRVVHETIPAVWGYEKRHVLVRPERTERYVLEAEYGYETVQVMIQPKQKRVIALPAEYAWRERTVLVSEGHSGWKRFRPHCKG
jgi:hypothetical protein